MEREPHRAWRRVRSSSAGLVLLLMAGGTACGGGGPATSARVAAEEPTTTTAPGAAFAACLREHGVEVPDRARPADAGVAPPSSRPPGSRPSTSVPAAEQARLAAARQACQSLQPADRPAPAGPQSQAFQVYASCLKDHGVTVAAGAGAGSLRRDDPTFQAADAICAPLRPAQP